ncbi:MAG: 4Fe-4S dicluster domain-containing protein [Desulfobulbus sp.]|nr:4Fe-4S dicluster domain-containing protein [Desulfobulbus sp.]
MSKYIVTQNVADCIGCRACEVHCKDKNNTLPGVFYCRILEVKPEAGGKPGSDFVYLSCFHCEKPWCVDVCPTGAMRRRPEDGIVYVEQKACVGCKACITACPWTVPQWNPETGKVEKCDLCKDRIDQGLEPACITKCTTGCLSFTFPDKASQEARQSYAEKLLKHRR